MSSFTAAIPSFSLASIKNYADEVRAQVYPRNETERKVSFNQYTSIILLFY